jgi:hypothetical protein
MIERREDMLAIRRALKLDTLHVVYPGDRSFPLADRVTATPLSAMIAGTTPN